jgi:hypothetical protein
MMRFKVFQKDGMFVIKYRDQLIWRYIKTETGTIVTSDTFEKACDKIMQVCKQLGVERVSVKGKFVENTGEKSGN